MDESLRNWAHLVLEPVDVDGQLPIVHDGRERLPAPQAVVDGPGHGRTLGHLAPVFSQPGVQVVYDRVAVLLTHSKRPGTPH
jgi:hypothetical protein